MFKTKETIKVKINAPKKSLGKIFVGTDHAGFEMKEKLVPFIKKHVYEVTDCGAFKYEEFDDYPDFIAPLAKAVSDQPEKIKGIILGGSGQGEAIVANRFPNVRAVVLYANPIYKVSDIVKLSREHNDANILSLGARFLALSDAKEAIREWLGTQFSNEYKHIRRLKKLDRISREIRLKSHF